MAPENAVRADVAALAEHLRRSVEGAVHWHGHAATLEGRFLRRLAGALSAYEAAHGILKPTESQEGSAGDFRPPLKRQSCPACGAASFEAAGTGGQLRLICLSCHACCRPGAHFLVLTESASCPGCELGDRCTEPAGRSWGGK